MRKFTLRDKHYFKALLLCLNKNLAFYAYFLGEMLYQIYSFSLRKLTYILQEDISFGSTFHLEYNGRICPFITCFCEYKMV